MTVGELRALLASFPEDATVVAVYEAYCCESENIAVGAAPDDPSRVQINCDGADYLL